MICVSCVYACDELLDGLRAPPSIGRPSPAPRASGAATSTDVTTHPASRYFPGLRMRMTSPTSMVFGGTLQNCNSRGCKMLREPFPCTKSVTRGIRSGDVIVDCAHYTTEGRREDAPLSMPEAAERLGGDGFVWLALRDPSTEELEEVAQRFDLPPLAVEDAHESHQRPKIEDYDDDWFVVLKAASYDDARETVDFDEIQMFAGPSFAVVIRGGATNHLEGARKRLAYRPQLLEQGPVAVVWAVLDTVVDGYEPVLDGLERDIEDVEKAIFEEGRDQTQRIYFLRRELGRF